MKTMTATALARNLSQVLDRLALEGEEIVIERNHRPIGRLVPGPGRQTALEALADLYRTLPADAAAHWDADARRGFGQGATVGAGIRDPWRG